ncbi:hypothetical protein NMY22_g7514 [Coprinellus aureogranulatus]|nr:hypothetical protein NMY22_g7514 [Coprinellus aureogranulatus]
MLMAYNKSFWTAILTFEQGLKQRLHTLALLLWLIEGKTVSTNEISAWTRQAAKGRPHKVFVPPRTREELANVSYSGRLRWSWVPMPEGRRKGTPETLNIICTISLSNNGPGLAYTISQSSDTLSSVVDDRLFHIEIKGTSRSDICAVIETQWTFWVQNHMFVYDSLKKDASKVRNVWWSLDPKLQNIPIHKFLDGSSVTKLEFVAKLTKRSYIQNSILGACLENVAPIETVNMMFEVLLKKEGSSARGDDSGRTSENTDEGIVTPAMTAPQDTGSLTAIPSSSVAATGPELGDVAQDNYSVPNLFPYSISGSTHHTQPQATGGGSIWSTHSPLSGLETAGEGPSNSISALPEDICDRQPKQPATLSPQELKQIRALDQNASVVHAPSYCETGAIAQGFHLARPSVDWQVYFQPFVSYTLHM